MLTSITLENWRSHQSTGLQFRKGTNLLIGIMGSGKSSVLDGISFALFGTFPALEHRKFSLEDILMHGKEHARITLGFAWKGEKYEIVREIKKIKAKPQTDAEIRKEGKLMEKGQTAVTKYVEQLLQIDYDLFSRAIYSEQNNIDYFLTLEAGKRKQEIDGLLGLDKFENARENCVKVINQKKTARKALDEKFSRQRLDEMREKENSAREKCSRLEEQKKSARISAEKSKSEHAELDSQFQSMKKRKERHDSIKQSSAKYAGMLEQLKEELKGKEANGQMLNEARAKKAEIENSLAAEKKTLIEFQSKQNGRSKEIGAAESRFETAKSAKAELEGAKIELEKILAGKTAESLINEKQAIEQKNMEIKASRQSLSSEIKKLEEGMKGLNPELSKCPLCRSQLTKEGIAHVLKEHENEIYQKKNEILSLNAQEEHNTKLWYEYDVKIKKVETLIHKLHMLEKNAAQYEEAAKALPMLKAEYAASTATMEEKRQSVERITALFQQAAMECKSMEELISKKNKMIQIEEEMKKGESELALLKFQESEFEAMRKCLEEKKLASERSALEFASLEKELKSAQELLAIASSEKAALENMENTIVQLLKTEEELSIYKNTLLETQATLRKEVIEAINTAMNGIWGMVYPYGDYKGLRISADEKGYGFEIYDGAWRPAELASGGERASIALAFRIALATVLTPNMSLLVLDEPTHNLDKEAVGVLAHALQYNLPELVEQSFVITHEEGLMGSEFASTYRMSRNKEANAPTIVEET